MNNYKDYGKYAILIARLLPFMSFDIVSYAAGLTGTVKTFVIGLLILFAVGALIVLLKKYGVIKIKVGGKLIVKFNMKEYCYTCGS